MSNIRALTSARVSRAISELAAGIMLSAGALLVTTGASAASQGSPNTYDQPISQLEKLKSSQPGSSGNGVCARTAKLGYNACGSDVADNYAVEVAKCLNETKAGAASACLQDAKAARNDDSTMCRDVRNARLEVCGGLTAGGGAYDPPIDSMQWLPADQIDGNTYFPLIPGQRYTYANTDGETIVVTVTNDTTEISGVPVRLVTDVATKDGKITEDTVDYYAEDILGNVWYFGETTKAVVEGTNLIAVDGSWEAGVDHAKPGIVMPGVPNTGDLYRQEWLLGDAEDVAKILSTTASESAPKVGPAVASCANNCVRTHDYSPIEPDQSETKFYAPGVGVIVTLDDNNPAFREELVKVETITL